MIYNKLNLVEGGHGHGALKNKLDFRDFKYKKLVGMASAPFVWVNTTQAIPPVSQLITEDQGTSGSCGGQSLRYKAEEDYLAKNSTLKRLSAKNAYSQIYYPGGGTTIRDLAKLYVNKGVCSETLVPSYDNGNPPTEIFMEDRSLNTPATVQDATLAEDVGFAFPKLDIETLASAFRDNNGGIIQINGQNNGTWLSTFPKPPLQNEWSHFLYCPKNCQQMINGVKGLWVKNSWGNSVGISGWQWLSQDYFNGSVTNAVVFYSPSTYQPYQPSPVQTSLTWLQKVLQWFGMFNVFSPNNYTTK